MEPKKIMTANFLDILFDGRNKDYGAYELRKKYNKRILGALLITILIALLAFLGSVLANSLDKGGSKPQIREVTLQNIKQEDEKKIIPPPPPKTPPPPPKVEMKQFTPPKIVKDEEVQKPPPEQTELKEAKIDVVNQEGIKDLNIATPAQIDEGKQVIEAKKETDDDNSIFTKVEIEATFPGGEKKWRDYLQRELRPDVPTDNNAPAGSYTVVIQFVVDKDGNVSDVKAMTNNGYGMEEEAMRVIKKGPKWEAAIQNGRKVKAYRKQPITFVVSSDE